MTDAVDRAPARKTAPRKPRKATSRKAPALPIPKLKEPSKLAPRSRGQAMDPVVRSKVWNDRMVLGHTITATATRNGVSESYVKKITTGQQVGSADYRRKAFSGPIPYKSLIPEAKRAYNDIAYFAERYFGLILMPWHVEAAMAAVVAVETDQREYIVTNCPPGAGKSTMMTLVLPAFLTVRNRAIRGMIVSNSQRNAERYVDALRRAFTQPLPVKASDSDLAMGIAVHAKSSLLRDFGVFKAPNADSGHVWSRKEFQVLQLEDRPLNEKEPTWSAFGMGGVFMGNRLDVILADDAYDKSANRTPETRAYFKTWFTVNVESRLEPGGMLMATGQRQHADDVYRFLLDKKGTPNMEDPDPRKYHHLVFKAHYNHLCTGEHGDVKPYPEGCLLYPSRLPYRDLQLVWIDDPQMWAVEYQQEDSAKGSRLVEELWVYGGVDPDTGVHYPGCVDQARGEWELPKGLGKLFYYATVDPSPENFWSIQFWAYEPVTEQRFLIAHKRTRMGANQLLDYDIDRGTYSGVMDEWQQRSRAWGRPIQYWIVEQNAAQRFLLQYDWFKKWSRARGTLAVAHDTGRNKSDPKLGVQAMATIYRQGKVRLPFKVLDTARVNTKYLIDEVLVWPSGGTDDCVMAQWFGEWNLPRLYRKPTVEAPQFGGVPSWVSQGLDNEAPVPYLSLIRNAS